MTVLLDTTVASLLHPRRHGSPKRALYEAHIRGHVLAISFQTYAELWQRAEVTRWGARERERLAAFLRTFLLLPFSEELGQTWARVMTDARNAGRRLEAGDGWIAAAAVHYGLALLTHDRDFASVTIQGLTVVSFAT
jgi:predicted nucleic acid-binding protein